MSFAFRTALAALLLVAAQSLSALDSNTDSRIRTGIDRAQPASKTPAADRAAELTKARSTDELYRRSGSGYVSRAATKPSSGTQSGELRSADKGGSLAISVFKSFEGNTCSGQEILYSIGIANESDAGTGTQSASITDDLDPNVNYVGGSATGGAVHSGGVISWSGSLAPGESHLITFRVVIKNVPDGTQIQNDPRYVMGPFDLRLSEFPGGSPLFFEVDCGGGGGTIAALGTKSAFSPFGGCPGDPIFYTITLTNLSAPSVGELPGFINDLLDFDVNLDFLAATDVDGFDIGDVDYDPVDHKISWEGDLDVGETVFIDVVVIVKDVPDWTPIVNDPFFALGPLQFLLPIPIVIPTICTDFIIDEGVTGSYSDSVYNGQGINVEIIAKDEGGFSGLAVVYWYSYDSFGLPFFTFGVGTYIGNIMIVDMLFDYDGDGPFFGPGWVNGQFEPFLFTDVILLWKDCDKLGFFFNDLPGLLALDFPWFLMNMTRITQVAGIPCPFQDHPPLGDKQLDPVQNPAPQQVTQPALKPLLDKFPDSTLDRAGGRERVYEKLGLNAQSAVMPAPKPAPAGDTQVAKGAFEIGIGMTGSFFDPSFNGQGINLEILSLPSADKGAGVVLMYWYTFDINGFPMFVFGVGNFTGNTMVFEMLVDWDGNGPIFGPLWNTSQFFPVVFATATVVWSDCDNGVMSFTMDPVFAGFGFVAHIMNLTRITEISKIECVD